MKIKKSNADVMWCKEKEKLEEKNMETGIHYGILLSSEQNWYILTSSWKINVAISVLRPPAGAGSAH